MSVATIGGRVERDGRLYPHKPWVATCRCGYASRHASLAEATAELERISRLPLVGRQCIGHLVAPGLPARPAPTTVPSAGDPINVRRPLPEPTRVPPEPERQRE